MSEENEFRTEKISLTAEQWVGLIDAEGEWLPHCCASISAARDVLADVLRKSGCMTIDQAREILCEIGEHDGRDASVRPILDGCAAWSEGVEPEHPAFAGRRIFWTREGSPWFEIMRACRALIGEGDIIESSREHRKAAIKRTLAYEAKKRGVDAARIAQSFHDTYERLAPSHGYETRRDSAKPFADVPEANKSLMIAAVSELLAHGVIEASRGRLPAVERQPQRSDVVTVGVQVNSATIGTVELPVDASAEEALNVALADYRVANRVRDAAVVVDGYKPGAILRLKTVWRTERS